jgi:hypothetical protein
MSLNNLLFVMSVLSVFYNSCLAAPSIDSVFPTDVSVDGRKTAEIRITLTGTDLPFTSTRDYIQDGLVSHLDAISNVGADQAHDSTAVTWTNLVSGSPLGDGQIINFTSNKILWSDGKSLRFQSANTNAWVRMSKYYPTTPITIEAAVKRFAMFPNYAQDLFANTQSGGGVLLYYPGDGRESFAYADTTGGYKYIYRTPDTDFHNYSMTVQPNSFMTGYIDGSQFGQVSFGEYKNPSNDTNVWAIGANPFRTDWEGEPLKGMDVYSLRFYNRILSQEERLHNLRIDEKRFNSPVHVMHVKIGGDDCADLIVESEQTITCAIPYKAAGTYGVEFIFNDDVTAVGTLTYYGTLFRGGHAVTNIFLNGQGLKHIFMGGIAVF